MDLEHLSPLSYSVIMRLTNSVAYKLTVKQEKVQNKVGAFMGGKVLDLPEIRIFKQAKAEAKAEDEAMIKGLEEKNRTLENEIAQLRAENERLRATQA